MTSHNVFLGAASCSGLAYLPLEIHSLHQRGVFSLLPMTSRLKSSSAIRNLCQPSTTAVRNIRPLTHIPILHPPRNVARTTPLRTNYLINPTSSISFLSFLNPFKSSVQSQPSSSDVMTSLYGDDTPDSVKNAKGLHLVTQSTPNGQKVQIMLEELAILYGTTWDFTLINIATNEQKKDWFLRLDPNGRIPILIDNTISPPFPVMETSAELMYLQNKYDKNNVLG